MIVSVDVRIVYNMKKTKQRSTVKKKPTKSENAIKTFEQEYYWDMFSLRQSPVSREYILKFSLEWVDYVCDTEKVITVLAYLNLKRLHEGTVYRWKDRHVELQEAFSFVKQVCADRRDFGAATRQLDAGWIKHTQPLYHTDFKALELWRNEMKEKIASAGNFIVEMNKMPETDIVPRRKLGQENDDI